MPLRLVLLARQKKKSLPAKELEHGLGFKADTLNVGTSPRIRIHFSLAIGATKIRAIRNGLEIDALQ